MSKRYTQNWVQQSFEKHWQKFPGYTKLGWFLKVLNLRRVKAILQKINLPAEAKILDVGCGEGATLTFFRRAGFVNSVGLDFCPSSIKLCQQRGFQPKRDVFLGDITHYRFSKKFDLVFADGLLEHFRDFQPVVAKMAKLTHRYLFLIQPDNFSLTGRLFKRANLWAKRNVSEIDYHPEDFLPALAEQGFRLKIFRRSLLGEMTFLLFEKLQGRTTR